MKGDGRNIAIRPENLVALRKAVIETLDQAIVGRHVMPPPDTSPLPGAESYGYDYRTHMSAAELIGKGDLIPRDSIKLTRELVGITKIAKGFAIAKEDLETDGYVRDGNARSAARMVAEAENDFIWNSADEPDINGLIDSTGNTTGVTAAWSGGVGVAYPVEDIGAARALLVADGFLGPYLMVVEAVNAGEAEFRQANLERTEMEQILAKSYIKEVFIDKDIPHGTIVVMQPSKEFMTIAEADPIELEGPFYHDEDQTYTFNITVRETIAVMQPNAICTLTGA